MKVIKDIKAFQQIADYYRAAGKKIGFVPTMGYLHEGHVSLILAAKDECDIVVVSIFVNPTQFLPGEDLNEYPRDFLRDFHICKNAGVDYIFNPEKEDMYPEGYSTYVSVNEISDRLEGKYRPGHFLGVTTIVMKFFNIVKPHYAYFGQKDGQQAVIIKRMVNDLNVDVNIRICKTMRDENGLAMSSRNLYLNEIEKKQASVLNRALNEAKRLIMEAGINDTKIVRDEIRKYIESEAPLSQIQYISITDNSTLRKVKDLENFKGEILISLAVYFRKTRLIDNVIFEK
ncbi:MAG: pantoate--beta-alanine ligase [Ignavibacteria bacterium]|nr:pantoate--beta-alanine ligase [Ignavibacteria bacterium]